MSFFPEIFPKALKNQGIQIQVRTENLTPLVSFEKHSLSYTAVLSR